MKFSSPSGDGLVPILMEDTPNTTCFRPRVGMGWFKTQKKIRETKAKVFVPEWGWVGS